MNDKFSIIMSSKEIIKSQIKGTPYSGAANNQYSPSWVLDNSDYSPAYKLALIEKIRTGVTKKEWKELITFIEATEKDFKNILPCSMGSRQKKDIYNQETSEKIFAIARLFGLGYEVFDSSEKFKNWLFTPSKALGNKKPFDILDSSLRIKVVENEITRIKYNVYC
ncbi:antitoxin Xre/MbcA/ParS toxin-binding domain-containing protein [Sphingobacterium sp.]|uniref:antitoxin Xre/MbcA/ParS toxin-binding domain-containing protein n=1 Tax=Sphingobacterium sp. TaxID=341027 RepID=UPI0028ACB65A|nr:antitoxin Xre/MbcA/ParS toxin-binding domain-containing protein [Sphingobacterium sp.]